ncbi:tubulin polyglutamylase complex subunit 2 [Bombina bombina]|uniref:tubulin polyglutamylase complex subunit 2 n=1 Tax=Bombina bombina TaxID=8345 RepID=UPI00235B0AC3|nr:tubulin polyglutamylase complex subunit 2 [Bombina bombina]XP_053557025.1 tubulin polyglutamylase complex subunit 2 [Bombina bombina]
MDDKTNISTPSYTEKMTLGISKILESSPGVTEVKFEEKPPAERHMIVSWEQKNSCTLPDDLKNFYLMTDGFQMTWNVKIDENPVQVGSMVINSISNLNRLGGSAAFSLPNAPTLADVDSDTDEEVEGRPEKPHFDSRNAIFELDPCNGNGKVCLVYKTLRPGITMVDPSIWFLDRALYWHFLTNTFTSYYRLMICHLGLPQWQYFFTRFGLSPQAKQWFNMYKPITFNNISMSEEADSFVNKLDPNKLFKSKNKTPVTKKKLPAPPTGSQKGNPTSAKTTPHPGSVVRK